MGTHFGWVDLLETLENIEDTVLDFLLAQAGAGGVPSHSSESWCLESDGRCGSNAERLGSDAWRGDQRRRPGGRSDKRRGSGAEHGCLCVRGWAFVVDRVSICSVRHENVNPASSQLLMTNDRRSHFALLPRLLRGAGRRDGRETARVAGACSTRDNEREAGRIDWPDNEQHTVYKPVMILFSKLNDT